MTRDIIRPDEVLHEMENRLEGSWFCALTAFGLTSDEKLGLMAVKYFPHGRECGFFQTKFPGGSMKADRGDKVPLDTLFAEADEEVFRASGTLGTLIPFHRFEFPNRVGPDQHIKYFVLVDGLEGDLREVDFHEGVDRDERGKITDEVIGPPRFESLNRILDGTMNPHYHMPALCSLLHLCVFAGRPFFEKLAADLGSDADELHREVTQALLDVEYMKQEQRGNSHD